MTREEIKTQAAHYTKIVEWSDEDQCFIGSCPEIMLGGIHGQDEAKVYAELCDAVEEMIELINTDGDELPESFSEKKFSGKFVLRVEPVVHRRLTVKALAAGESLNAFCAKMLSKGCEIKNIPDLGNTNLSIGRTDQQEEVFKLLQSFSTDKKQFHIWYQGILEVINSQFQDKVAQAAHSLRELCDELPSAIAGIPRFKTQIPAVKALGPHFLEVKNQFYANGWTGEVINSSFNDVLYRLEKLFNEPARTKQLGRALTTTEPQFHFLSKDWLRERDDLFERFYRFVQNVAHHNHSANEDEFNNQLNLFESLLLNYLTPCTASQQKELLSLMAGPANSETFAKVSKLILYKTANYSFFFDKLTSPEWLKLLDKEGLFEKLPGPDPAEDGRLRYKHYLPLMVLTRLAKSHTQLVTGILVKLRLPENPYVGDQVLQCMAEIRDPECIHKMSPLIVQLAENPARTSWSWIQQLLESWIESKAFEEVFAILRAYLNSAVDKSFEEFRDEFGIWVVKQIDEKAIDNLASAYPFEVADIIYGALCKWVCQEREKYNESEIGRDAPFSYFIEDFKSTPLMHRGMEATLARRLFSAAERIYSQNDTNLINKLDQLLRSNPWQLFQRLRWQLYADFPNLTLEHARAEVLQRIPNMNSFDYCIGSHDYEFVQLLLAHVKQNKDTFLSPKEVEEFFEITLKGPIDNEGKPIGNNNNFFYVKQLWPIAPLLRGKQLDTYRTLVPDDSKINIEDFKPFHSEGSGGSVISKAPQEAENLHLLKDEELWKLLNEWESQNGYRHDPSGRLYYENIFELAAKFVDLVEKQPNRFIPATRWWENIKRSEVLNKLLDRAADRISKKPNEEGISDNDWANWLGIVQWIVNEQQSLHTPSRFLRTIAESAYPIPNDYASAFPELLSRLVEDEDPRLRANKILLGDWYTMAINSTRGEAIGTLLSLALKQKNAGKEIEPWIYKIIVSRLKLPDESPAVFSLLGAKLRLLIHLFGRELNEVSTLLFSHEKPGHCNAAVVAHFKYDQPWNRILQIFPNLINTGIDTLAAVQAESRDDETKKNFRDFGTRLGIHICCYYWSGSFASNDEAEHTIDRFFGVSSSDTRSMVVSQIASIWEKQDEKPQDEKIIKKVMRIWEKRYIRIERKLNENNVSLPEYESELAESTDWLGCECFPFEWRFSYAKSALGWLKKAPRSYHLLKSITEFGAMPERLEPMLDLLQTLLKKPSDELRWSIQSKDLAPIISQGLSNGNPNIVKLAKGCQDLLLRMGLFDFLPVGDANKSQL